MANPSLTIRKPFLSFKIHLLCLLFSLGNIAMVFAQEARVIDVGPTLFKSFQRPAILKLTLTTATKQLVSKKFKEEWQPITLNYQDASGTDIEWEAKVRTRGNIRKQVCFYPPLKLKFKKKWLVENGLDSNFNDLKLVVGCKKGDFYGKLVLKEYLVYKLYEALTGISFRTQLAEIDFIDTENKWKPLTTYAFFIENQDEMATRLNAKCAKPKRLRSKYMYADQLDKMALFEYMIGNTDWSAVGSHNVRLIKCKDYPLPLPIAYDFDYAGLVDAPYAVHGKGIDLEHVTERLFLGMCREEGVLEKQIPVFQEKKAAFYQIINDFPYLDAKDKKIMIGYLDEFYDVLDCPNSFKRNISDYCRKEGR
ncbi:MAG: hypothetical protein AB8G86_14010 [Saprospiraceae bacterium]